MANELLEKIKAQQAGQQAAIAARHPEMVEPTKQELLTGQRQDAVAPVETPLMLEGIDEAAYGQAVGENPEIAQMLDEAVPQLAQEQQIPMAPVVDPTQAQVVIPEGQVQGQMPAQPRSLAGELETAYAHRGTGVIEENLALAEQQKQIADAQLNQAAQDKIATDTYIKGRNERLEQKKIEGKKLQEVLAAPMKVDPSQWWNSRTTGQKVSASVAALLSGFGGQAMSIMQNAIKADIAAQKENWNRKRDGAKGIYAIAKEMGIEEEGIESFAMLTARRQADMQTKAAIQRTNNPAIKSRGMKLLANNRIAYLKDIAAIQTAQAKAKGSVKKGKLGAEEKKTIFLSNKTLGAIKRMKSSFKKGDWTRSMVNNEFKTALREGSLLLGFMLSGANVAEREAEVIGKMLKGDLTQGRKSIIDGLSRWEKAISDNIGLTLETSGLDESQIDSLKSRMGYRPVTKRQPKTFKSVR